MPHPFIRFPSTAKFSFSVPSAPPCFRVQVDAPSQASNRCLRQCGLPQGAGLFCIWLSRKARRPRLQPGTGRAVSPQCLLWPRPCILEHTAFLAQQRGRAPEPSICQRVMSSTPPHPTPVVVPFVVGMVVVAVRAAGVPMIVVEGAAPQHPAAAVGLPLPARWNHLTGAIIIPQPLAQVKSQGLVEITGISFLG